MLRPRTVLPEGPVLLPESPEPRVRIVLLSGIGDVVHGLPLAADVKALRPHARVTWIAEPAPAELLSHHPEVDRVVVFRPDRGLRGLRDLRAVLATDPADLTLNVQRYFKSVWPTLMSRAPARVGLPVSKTRDGIRFAHTHVLRDGPWKHVQDLFLDFRWALGAPRAGPVRWGLTLTGEEAARARRLAEERAPRPLAGLVVASANPKKDWLVDRYARLAEALSADFGMAVVLLGGPSERERRVADAIVAGATCHATPLLCSSVRQLMTAISASSLVVAPDTGPVHIAHALDVPVISLYGHTNPWRVGPWSRFHDLVVDRYTPDGTQPDSSGYLPRDDRMEAIAVEDVLEKVQLARARYA